MDFVDLVDDVDDVDFVMAVGELDTYSPGEMEGHEGGWRDASRGDRDSRATKTKSCSALPSIAPNYGRRVADRYRRVACATLPDSGYRSFRSCSICFQPSSVMGPRSSGSRSFRRRFFRELSALNFLADRASSSRRICCIWAS